MKIIDLLNKIANGEEVPRKFIYNGYLWEYDVKNKMWFYYFGKSKNHRFDRLFYLNMILNEEVKILEEPKGIPEKLECNIGIITSSETNDKQEFLQPPTNTEIMDKINEIIDYLKSKGDE